MIKKFDQKLVEVKPEEAKTKKDDREKLLKDLGKLRKSALCQASIVSSDILPKIDKLVAKIQFEKIAIFILILYAFKQTKPDEIAKILDEKRIKPFIIDDILIKVQEKFFEKISGLIAYAVKKFGNEKTHNLKGLIEDDIPEIQKFLYHPSFQNKEDS